MNLNKIKLWSLLTLLLGKHYFGHYEVVIHIVRPQLRGIDGSEESVRSIYFDIYVHYISAYEGEDGLKFEFFA